jgi:hypothetical protein
MIVCMLSAPSFVEPVKTSTMYDQSTAIRRFDTNSQPPRTETDPCMRLIESKLDILCEELRSLRRELESERSNAELNRWFWLIMLFSAVLNLIIAAG